MINKVTHQKCEQWLAVISDYIDGELNTKTCNELEAHLTNCTDCTLLLNTTNKTIGLAQRLTSQKIPAEIKNRLLNLVCEIQENNCSDYSANGSKTCLAICPHCGERTVDVDGMLNRYCTKCDWHECGGFT